MRGCGHQPGELQPAAGAGPGHGAARIGGPGASHPRRRARLSGLSRLGPGPSLGLARPAHVHAPSLAPPSPSPLTPSHPPQEYDAADTKLTPAQQRAALKKRLLGGSAGGVAEQLMDVDDMVDDADIAAALEPSKSLSGKQAGKQAAAELLVDMAGLSARERNKLRRKTKALTRMGSTASRECSPRVVRRRAGPLPGLLPGPLRLLGVLLLAMSGRPRVLMAGALPAAAPAGERPGAAVVPGGGRQQGGGGRRGGPGRGAHPISCLPACLPARPPACPPACTPARLPACLPACLPPAPA